MRRTVTTTREYDAEGRVTKETVVEQTYEEPAPLPSLPLPTLPGPQPWNPGRIWSGSTTVSVPTTDAIVTWN